MFFNETKFFINLLMSFENPLDSKLSNYNAVEYPDAAGFRKKEVLGIHVFVVLLHFLYRPL